MAKEHYKGPLERVSDYLWRIPRSYRPDMLVDGLIFADDQLIDHIRADTAPEQVANVATSTAFGQLKFKIGKWCAPTG